MASTIFWGDFLRSVVHSLTVRIWTENIFHMQSIQYEILEYLRIEYLGIDFEIVTDFCNASLLKCKKVTILSLNCKGIGK